MNKVKFRVYSSDSVKTLCERAEKAIEILEEKENRSVMRTLWDGLTKKPVIGKRKNNDKHKAT